MPTMSKSKPAARPCPSGASRGWHAPCFRESRAGIPRSLRGATTCLRSTLRCCYIIARRVPFCFPPSLRSESPFISDAEAVADTGFGEDVFGVGGVALDFGAHLTNEHPQQL